MAIVGTASKPGILINREFALLWTGRLLSVLGDNLFETTLIVWIASDLAEGTSWAALTVSGLLAASVVPTFLVGPVAGVFVDRRRSKRRVMIRADAVSALLILLLLPIGGIVPLPFLPEGRLPLGVRLGGIFTIVFLASAVAQFFRPASSVLLRDILPEEAQPRAIGLNQSADSFALLIGPPLAAPLLFAFGPSWALLLNAASFLASIVAVRAIRAVPPALDVAVEASASGVFRELAEGLRFFRQSRVLVTVAVALVIAALGLGALNALDIFFVTENLGVRADYYGIFSAALGAGMLVGAAISSWFATRIGLERLVWSALATLGLLVVAYARLTNFVPGVVAIFLIGAIVPAINVSVGPILLRETPRAFLGRVSGTINPLVSAASILGMLAGGILYGGALQGFHGRVFGLTIGPLDTIFTGVGALCLLGAAYAFVNLRRTAPPATEQ